jgi:sugar lactone lactonase YvrE
MTGGVVKSIKCVWEIRATLGENPLYDPRNETLYWLDIKGEKLFALSLPSGDQQIWSISGNISALGLHEAGGLIAAGRKGFCHITFDEQNMPVVKYLNNPESHIETTRFNDGAIDPFGCFWAGTMDDAEKDAFAGNWWRYTSAGEVRQMVSGFHVTNGPAFDADRQLAYLTDSARQIIYCASYKSLDTFGALKPFKKFGKGEGYPDGMALDREGCLWVAFWDGACLRRISPEGEVVETVEMPTQRPTCPVIVGNKIYVTSASIGLEVEKKQNALAGSLFELTLNDEKDCRPVYFSQAC